MQLKIRSTETDLLNPYTKKFQTSQKSTMYLGPNNIGRRQIYKDKSESIYMEVETLTKSVCFGSE